MAVAARRRQSFLGYGNGRFLQRAVGLALKFAERRPERVVATPEPSPAPREIDRIEHDESESLAGDGREPVITWAELNARPTERAKKKVPKSARAQRISAPRS